MFCANCGANIPDGTAVCPQCGKPLAVPGSGPAPGPGPAPGSGPAPGPEPGQPVYPVQSDMFDHTAEMDPRDIAENKVIAMLPYLTSLLGVIICALLCRESKFANFHVRQSLKLTVCELLVAIFSAVLCWTCIVPVAGGICSIIILVLDIMGVVYVGKGQAKELPIVRGLKFLK